jgi:mono/diheme cytochrome c family protein/rhodanese-related sulfurtransferase
MWKSTIRPLLVCLFLIFSSSAINAINAESGNGDDAVAAADYQRYCALCHGAERQGYVNDDAPSLRSKSLMSAGFNERLMAVSYGRRGTAMGGFLDEVGGPMSEEEIKRLMQWLQKQSGVEAIELPLEPIVGDVELGKEIYAEECAACHGDSGEGDIGPALGNPAMLSLTSDAFLRYAIENGRDGTDMPSFADVLEPDQIDAVTAFLRSRATGWAVEKPVFRTPPSAENYVLNPASPGPEFQLKDELYVLAKDLNEAIQNNRRMVLLDTRVTSMWQMAHIEGSVPVPYYYELYDSLVADLPSDGTWIVTYCECPRAAAEDVNRELRDRGFKNTAVLWEGIQGWVSLGYPVSRGEVTLLDLKKDP